MSPEAADGWKQFAARNGITVEAMREVVGRWLAAHPDVPPHIDVCIEKLVNEATMVTGERKDRHPPDGDDEEPEDEDE